MDKLQININCRDADAFHPPGEKKRLWFCCLVELKQF